MFNVAIFGAGRFGAQHVAAWNSTPRSTVVAIIDPRISAENGVYRSSDSRIPVVSSLRDIPQSTSVDAAAIVTPVWSHLGIAQQLCRRGIPFLVEKPVAATSVDAQKVADIVRESGVISIPGHIMRFSQPHIELHETMARLGHPPVVIRLRRDRSAALLDIYPGEHPALLTGIHDIDLAMWLANSPVVEVTAVDKEIDGRPMSFQATLTHANGSRSVVSGAYTFPVTEADRVSDEIVIRGHDGETLADYRYESDGSASDSDAPDPSLLAEIEHFIDLVSGVFATPVVTLDDAAISLAVVEAIIQSSELKGSTVQVAAPETAVQ